MQANRSVSGLERRLRSALWRQGVRGYRLHPALPGRPDLVFSASRLAVFVHGCFWHRCPRCALRLPKANAAFWKLKFEQNLARDGRASEALRAEGWRVMVVWECDVRRNDSAVARRVARKAAGLRSTAGAVG